MSWFQDDWDDGGFGMDDTPAPVAQKQQDPIGHQTTTQPKAVEQPKPTPPAPVQQTNYEAPPQTNNAYGAIFQADDWGDDYDYKKIIPDTQNAPQQPEKTEETEEVEVRQEEEKVVEPDTAARSAPISAPAPIAAPKKDPTRPPTKPPAQADSRNELISMGPSSGIKDWGKQNISNLTTAPAKRRRNEKPARKAPMKNKQSVAPNAAPQPPVGSASKMQVTAPSTSKIQVTTDPTSVSSEDLVQTLMEKVRELERKVEELEHRQIQQLGNVCTLNSTGKVNSEFQVVWDSTNHIIRPQKGLKLVEPEKVFLEVSHRGLYQITFTTCGTNPQLIINGHVYAAARSAPTRDARQLSSTSCVNIYLYLDEKATIAGKVTDEIASENPCEHWMCVRLVHQGF